MIQSKNSTVKSDFIPGSSYYIGANTARGFVSLYPMLTAHRPTKRIYRIEGGPGTGKSYTMKRVAEEAEKQGLSVERGYCSSDPDSLDAVRVLTKDESEQILLLDATAPHHYGGIAPGAVTRTVDLGRFRDDGKLEKQRDTVLRLEREKKEHYETAYRFLSCEGAAITAKRSELALILDAEMMKDVSSRLFLGANGSGGVTVTRPIEAVSMRGTKVLVPTACGETRVFAVEDVYGSSEPFLSAMLAEAAQRRMTVFAYTAASHSDRILALRIPEVSLLLRSSTIDESSRAVRTQRFIDKNTLASKRGTLRALEKEAGTMKRLACEELAKAGVAHFGLETIYGQAMDFAAKDEEDARLVADVLACAKA